MLAMPVSTACERVGSSPELIFNVFQTLYECSDSSAHSASFNALRTAAVVDRMWSRAALGWLWRGPTTLKRLLNVAFPLSMRETGLVGDNLHTTVPKKALTLDEDDPFR